MKTGKLSKAREVIRDNNNLREGSITLAFQRAGKDQVTYSHRPPTKLESHLHHVLWMAEKQRPFELLNDKGYRRIMKEGRPEHYVPSLSTVSQDVKNTFKGAREQISKLLRVSVNKRSKVEQADDMDRNMKGNYILLQIVGHHPIIKLTWP